MTRCIFYKTSDEAYATSQMAEALARLLHGPTFHLSTLR